MAPGESKGGAGTPFGRSRQVFPAGGVRPIRDKSIAARAATSRPTMRWVQKAELRPAKPSTQGESRTQSPTTRLIHSSHARNRTKAAKATIAITAPLITAFQLGSSAAAKPTAQGET